MAQPISPETVAVAGYAAVFGQPDLTGDIIRPGAFQQSIKKMRDLIPAASSRVMMLYQHAADRPVGRWDELKEDSHGLFVRGHLFADTRDGRDLVQLLQVGQQHNELVAAQARQGVVLPQPLAQPLGDP